VRTVTVQSILLNAASRAGLDGSDIANLSTTTKTIMLDNLNIHLRTAWELFDWPDLTTTESRTVQVGVDGDAYIDKAQATKVEMGEVFNVMQDNPTVSASPRQISYALDTDKIRLPSDSPATVYVRYRTLPTIISATIATALAQTVPGFLADYCKFMLTGDLLTEDGQLDKAEIMASRAENYIVAEMDKLTFQQNQPRRWSAVTTNY
jgi:hypothetical protein